MTLFLKQAEIFRDLAVAWGCGLGRSLGLGRAAVRGLRLAMVLALRLKRTSCLDAARVRRQQGSLRSGCLRAGAQMGLGIIWLGRAAEEVFQKLAAGIISFTGDASLFADNGTYLLDAGNGFKHEAYIAMCQDGSIVV